MMAKFKVGDRVRSLDSGYAICGQVGVITSVRDDGRGYHVEFAPNKTGALFHHQHELERESASAPETITLREQFAMAALTGLISDPGTKYNADHLAKNAYDIADAMLAERERVK